MTLIGSSTAIFSISLSFLADGVEYVKTRYENEISQTEDNLIQQVSSKSDKKSSEKIKLIMKSVKVLKKKKRLAKRKLDSVTLSCAISRLSVPFLVSIIINCFCFIFPELVVRVVLLSLSMLSLTAGIISIYWTVDILVEIIDSVNKTRRDDLEKIVNLLGSINENTGVDKAYIPNGGIRPIFMGIKLDDSKLHEFAVNVKQEISVGISNSTEKMAKAVQIGFCFPKEALIEESDNISLYTDETNQIVRLNRDKVFAKEIFLMKKLKITFLKQGDYEIPVFIKGENVTYEKLTFNIRVI